MTARENRSTVPYGIHPSVDHARAIIANLPDRTGKPIEQWVRLIRKEAPADAKERREWLKRTHGIGGTTAALILGRVDGDDAAADPRAYLAAAGKYVEAMYAGPKEALRPVYDGLLELGKSLGDDVRACPCKTVVPLYRNHVFAGIKPSTRTRVDLGLALKGSRSRPPKRLVETGGAAKGDRITHRIPLGSVDEIDGQVERWLRIAYDLDS